MRGEGSVDYEGRLILASNPCSPFWTLSRSFGDKIRNGEPGFEARLIPGVSAS